MTRLAFVDCETTGLDPLRHEVWEVALVVRTLPDEEGKSPPDEERHWFLPVDLGAADPVALSIGGYYERYEAPPAQRDVTRGGVKYREWIDHVGEFATEFARLTHGAQLVGAVPSFDAGFLGPLLRTHGACPGWHYHLIDVEPLAWGWVHGRRKQLTKIVDGLGSRPDYADLRVALVAELRGLEAAIKAIGLPFESEELSRACGVDPDRYPKHTARGDVDWVMALYDKVVD